MKKDRKFPFTETRLAQLIPVDKKIRYSDESVKGLVVIVYPTGLSTYYVYKRMRGVKAPISKKIGEVGITSLKSARDQALQILADMVLGLNPNQHYSDYAKGRLTLLKGLNDFVQAQKGNLAESTLDQYESTLKNYSPYLLERKIKDITRQDIRLVHADITLGKCSWIQADGNVYTMTKPSPSQADLWGRVMKLVINYAMDEWRGANDQALILTNPVRVLSSMGLWNKVPSKKTKIYDYQFAAFFDVLDYFRCNVKKSTELAIADALQFAIFTGLRLNEVLYLTKDRVNFEEGIFWISNTKNGEPLELPITDAIYSVLERRLELVPEQCDYFFPSRCNSKPIQDVTKTIDNLKRLPVELTGCELHMNFHDMRRTFSSVASILKINKYVIKRLINHKLGESFDITDDYMSFSASELKKHSENIQRYMLEKAGRLEGISTHIEEKLVERFRDLDDDKKKSLMALIGA
ncbi:tyrosine-type recombinase/integrase [Vibrio breoganii]